LNALKDADAGIDVSDVTATQTVNGVQPFYYQYVAMNESNEGMNRFNSGWVPHPGTIPGTGFFDFSYTLNDKGEYDQPQIGSKGAEKTASKFEELVIGMTSN